MLGGLGGRPGAWDLGGVARVGQAGVAVQGKVAGGKAKGWSFWGSSVQCCVWTVGNLTRAVFVCFSGKGLFWCCCRIMSKLKFCNAKAGSNIKSAKRGEVLLVTNAGQKMFKATAVWFAIKDQFDRSFLSTTRMHDVLTCRSCCNNRSAQTYQCSEQHGQPKSAPKQLSLPNSANS